MSPKSRYERGRFSAKCKRGAVLRRLRVEPLDEQSLWHDGRITTDVPDEMWGTDATNTLTREGRATIFLAVDHCTSECIVLHTASVGDRFEALDPLRQGSREHFGGYE